MSDPLIDALDQTVRALFDERRQLRALMGQLTTEVIPDLQERLRVATAAIEQLTTRADVLVVDE